MLINSDFSKIRIEETNSLVSDSKSDSYNIGSIRNLVSESVYSTFEIEEFSGQLKSLATFGSITVSDLKKEFTSVDIECDHAPVFLKAGGATSFKSDIKTTNTLVDFPAAEYPYLVKTTDRNNIVLTGILGNNQETNSLVKIRATFGKLSIY